MIYAIPDSHGRMDLVEKLYNTILEDISKTKELYNEIVWMGDYVDRGPSSKSVLDFLMKLENTDTLKHIILQGNHEDFMINYKIGNTFDAWWNNGGDKTLESFGINLHEADGAKDMVKLEPYIEWLSKLPFYYEKHNMIFCHSGYIRTDFPIALDAQKQMLLWGRPHKNMYVGYNKLIIHGHTPTDGKPYVELNRINIDTGGWYRSNNWMHAVVLPDQNATENDARFIKITV